MQNIVLTELLGQVAAMLGVAVGPSGQELGCRSVKGGSIGAIC
jgi:hypothetical protein